MSELIPLTELRKKCEGILKELHEIVAIIESNLHIPKLAKRIDTFFYIESNTKIMRMYDQLDACWQADHALAQTLDEIRLQIRNRWQTDHMFIACPPSLHGYLDNKIPSSGELELSIQTL